MSCRHDLANGTCLRCYPTSPRATIDPGPEEDYPPNLDGPGAATAPPEEILAASLARWEALAHTSTLAAYSAECDRRHVVQMTGQEYDEWERSRDVATRAAVLALIAAVRDLSDPFRVIKERFGFEVRRVDTTALELTDHELEGLRALVKDMQATWVRDHQKDGLRALARHLEARKAGG